LFLVALDERGEWFRYHHLFAEAIQAEARARAPELVRSAHERAADWFERHDDLVTALDHWFAADRPEEALRIALAAGYQLIDSGQVASVERIIRLIPPSVVGKDPHHQLDYAMLHNHIDAEVCLRWVNEAQKSIGALTSADDQLTRRYHSVRAMCCLLFGEWDDALTNASASIDPLGVGEGDAAMAQRAGLHLMRAHGWMEETNDAEKVFRTYVGSPWTSPVVRNVLAPCSWALAAAFGGRIHEAESWCSRVTATAHDVALPQAAFQELLLARAVISNELADTDSARRAIEELRATHVMTFHSLRAIAEIEMALSLVNDDHFVEATHVLDALALAHPHIALGPRVQDAIDRAWTELHLRTGDIVNARHAAGRMRVGFWRDATLAKVFLIDGQTRQAAEILGQLSATSPRQEVTLLLLRAISLPDHDQHRLELVEAALTIASAEGMLQTVVTAARNFADVVESASVVVPDDWMHTVRLMLAKSGRGATTGRVPTLYEQPTERERVIARYLPSRLTVPEIAREIGVTPNTLKSHLKSLYRKLDVTTREDAVATARRLGIIG
jgi:LuxR family maltose regulon positive regulatory protein